MHPDAEPAEPGETKDVGLTISVVVPSGFTRGVWTRTTIFPLRAGSR